jgi:hypothetical protein
MNPGLLHEHLTEQGFDVISVDEKGNVVLADTSSKTGDELVKTLADYKEPTRDERKAKILAKRDELINELLFERFLGADERTQDGLR